MGIGLLGRNCSSQPYNPIAKAPDPSPSRWTLVDKTQYENAYILIVHYHDCTNFEGRKIMVYEGTIPKNFCGHGYIKNLDPHFQRKGGPIARFIPTPRGIEEAHKYAENYKP